jgi:hypothetical protein
MRIREILVLAATILPISVWLMFSLVVIARGPMRRCPKCGAKRIRRTSRRWVDSFLPAFIAPRRCEVCRKRFHHLKSVNYLSRRPSVRTSPDVRRPQPAHSS